jgi:hypothetical protein
MLEIVKSFLAVTLRYPQALQIIDDFFQATFVQKRQTNSRGKVQKFIDLMLVMHFKTRTSKTRYTIPMKMQCVDIFSHKDR